MQRKVWALICFALSVAMHVYLHLSGRTEADPGWFLWPFIVGVTAFLLPAMLPVCFIERLLGFAPWGEGHTAQTYLWMTLAASLIWFFPAARLARMCGAFDGFREGLWLRLHRRLHLPDRLRSLSLWRGLDFVHEQVNKRLFGRQKTGGWA